MIEVKFTGETLHDIQLQAEIFCAELVGNKTEASKSAPVAAPKPAPKAAPAPAPKTAPKPVAKAAPKPAPKPAPAEAEDDGAEVSYEDVKALILELGNTAGKGRPAVAAVLAEFGVEKGPELQPDQYAEALEALKAKLAE